jgi:hypothetical protein
VHRHRPAQVRADLDSGAVDALEPYVFAGQVNDPYERCDPLPAHIGAGKKICSSRCCLGARNGHDGHGFGARERANILCDHDSPWGPDRPRARHKEYLACATGSV